MTKRYRVRVTALDESGGENPKIRPAEYVIDEGQTISLRAEDLAVVVAIWETASVVEEDPFPELHGS